MRRLEVGMVVDIQSETGLCRAGCVIEYIIESQPKLIRDSTILLLSQFALVARS